MLIEPNTTIRLFHNCPLDNTYRDTVKYTSVSNQIGGFSTLLKYRFDRQSFTRVNRGVIRVQVNVANIYDCNYMAFQNSAYGVKWFYAFITSVEYVNDNTSEITFQIDVMQTWLFEFTAMPSFVEREHSVTDAAGDNLVPESLEIGDYVINGPTVNPGLLTKCAIVACTFDADGGAAGGQMFGGLFSGLSFFKFTDMNRLAEFIVWATGQNLSDGIVCIFYGFDELITNTGLAGQKDWYVPKQTTLDGYTPKNKKLLTYPYNVLYVTNHTGGVQELHYEYFSGDTASFTVFGSFNCNPEMANVPLNYKGVTANWDEKLLLTGLPQIAYATDSFKAWLAQNAGSLIATGANAALTTGVGLATGGLGLAAGVASGGSKVMSLLGTLYDKSRMPPEAHVAGGGNITAGMGELNYFAYRKTIRREFAEIIDGYFNMYGYATHKVKVPNMSSRPYWNYVKTVDACIVGSIPAPDMAQIKANFNNGITFWNNLGNVGHYELDNSPR